MFPGWTSNQRVAVKGLFESRILWVFEGYSVCHCHVKPNYQRVSMTYYRNHWGVWSGLSPSTVDSQHQHRQVDLGTDEVTLAGGLSIFYFEESTVWVCNNRWSLVAKQFNGVLAASRTGRFGPVSVIWGSTRNSSEHLRHSVQVGEAWQGGPKWLGN